MVSEKHQIIDEIEDLLVQHTHLVNGKLQIL